MGAFSIWHWVIVLVVVLILFGGSGKLSRLMGDAARGINAFKKGLKEDKGDEGAPDSIDKGLDAEKRQPASSDKKDEEVKS
ncbi:MAG: twin-arginine translocase TatA/TatE family subunit [Pseudomonadota bacterium]|nr:twin-arginine translocase TatA/TatE family subunit [Pseudomonadota bacterium]